MTPRVRVIAVSYFGANDAKKLLRSLQSQTMGDWEFVLVENSVDATQRTSLQTIGGDDPRVRVLTPDENLGYLGAARFAREHSQGTAEWTVIANVDIELPDSDSLLRLSEFSEAGVAVVAPGIISSRSGRDQNPFLVHRPTAQQMRRRAARMRTPAQAQLTAVASKLKRMALPSSATQAAGRIYAPHGSFMAIAREYFENGGTLEHPIFLFAEELTLAERVRALGMTVAYLPSIQVSHVEHGQMGVIRSGFVLREMVRAARYGATLIEDESG
ncbi:glycosyltransferase family 2 protein [Agromyces sp. NPDC058484]|uniref:glycosyltransferase family 2 protein n=1 Tax=Agromyces sp. NPDC058484 TaxID=3346524 RepID=UPI00364B246D